MLRQPSNLTISYSQESDISSNLTIPSAINEIDTKAAQKEALLDNTNNEQNSVTNAAIPFEAGLSKK